MSYALLGDGIFGMAGLGAISSLEMRYNDYITAERTGSGQNWHKALMKAVGPFCGGASSQIGAQIMLGDLGYGAGLTDRADIDFQANFHKFAVANNIAHTEGTLPTSEMCGALINAWQPIAVASQALPGFWEPPPHKPVNLVAGYFPVAIVPDPADVAPQPQPTTPQPSAVPRVVQGEDAPLPSRIPPQPGAPLSAGAWWASQAPTTQLAVVGGGVALLLGVVLLTR